MHRTIAQLTGILAFTASSAAEAQGSDPVVWAIERFVEECSSAMSDPSAYIETARSLGQGGPVAVAGVANEPIFWVLDMTPPGEMYVHIGEVSGRTRVYCTIGLFNIPELRDPTATNQTFLDWIGGRHQLGRTGGAVDLKALMAGDEGVTGEEVEMTAQIYQHLVSGWSDADAPISVAIQTGVIELDAEHVMNAPLSVEPMPASQ